MFDHVREGAFPQMRCASQNGREGKARRSVGIEALRIANSGNWSQLQVRMIDESLQR